MTLDELKAEISERIESEQEKLNRLNDRKSRKDKHYYISERRKQRINTQTFQNNAFCVKSGVWIWP